MTHTLLDRPDVSVAVLLAHGAGTEDSAAMANAAPALGQQGLRGARMVADSLHEQS